MLRLPLQEDPCGRVGVGLVARHRRPKALSRGEAEVCCVTLVVPVIAGRSLFLGDDPQPRVRERGDGPGRSADRDRRGPGQDHEERRPAANCVGAVPRQEGARDQEHRPADARGPPQGHPRYVNYSSEDQQNRKGKLPSNMHLYDTRARQWPCGVDLRREYSCKILNPLLPSSESKFKELFSRWCRHEFSTNSVARSSEP